MKGFVIGATGSGTGKTTITLAVLAYLADQGYKVAPFKVGPDFIDPGHHTQIAGKTSFNLDSWMLSKEYNAGIFQENTKGADIAVVEGVMGLFDGFDGLSESGSTAQMAKWLNLPVVLIVDAKGMARSAAALVQGFENFDKDLKLAGVIFTKTGSSRHYDYLKKAVEQSCRTKCLGFMPRNNNIIMPQRHLGLVTAREQTLDRNVLSMLISMVRDHIDIKGLVNGLDAVEPLGKTRHIKSKPLPGSVVKQGPVIAVAKDRAFCFYYQDNLEILKKFGAEILEFSPLNNDKLPQNIDGIYFGGGYPEIFAKELSLKTDLLREIKEKSIAGMPIYGECGGFMFLCSKVSSMDETRKYSMCGCFDLNIQMSKNLQSLGYREIVLTQDTIIGKKGYVLKGHEFHYSSLANDDPCTSSVYRVKTRAGQNISLKGYQVFNTLGSYLHVHFGSNEKCAKHFVETCTRFKNNKNAL